MALITEEVRRYVNGGSMIRKMFEAGIELRKQFGADNVFDFSLGNPDLPPPSEVKAELTRIAETSDQPFALGYMPNAGFAELREALAEVVSREQGVVIPGGNVLLTCGAAGGLNVLFRAMLEAGDEVIVPAPYFVEYTFYAGNRGGILKPVATKADFHLDLAAIEAAVTPKTRAVILNSPNNPTGQIYTKEELSALAALLADAEKRIGREIFVIADEPYRFLNFDGEPLPGILKIFPHSVLVGSCSKNLSLAGERIGYLAVSPRFDGVPELMAALTISNRILGFVNAPVIGQKILLKTLGAQVDLEVYRARRAAMAKVFTEAGLEFVMPRGAFYFFPKSPVEDERIFIDALFKEHVLAVPGRGFGLAGHVRFAFCVDRKIIERSAEGIKRAVASFR